jgi:hypothetical protein
MQENLNLLEKMSTVTIANCDIGIYNGGPVGVLVSGGADSALLLYIILKYVKHHPIHVYSKLNKFSNSEQETAVDNVISTCVNLNNRKISDIIVHKLYADDADEMNFFSMCNSALNSGNIDILYQGLTIFPDKEVWKDWPRTYNFQENYEIRIDGIEHSLWGIENFGGNQLRSVDNRLYKPMMNKTKKDVAAMYRELGIESELYSKTRSCENGEVVLKNCGECWWCRERIWGFGYLH